MIFSHFALALTLAAAAQSSRLAPDPFTATDDELRQEQRSLQGADTADVAEGDTPTFVSLSASLNDFSRFADGGPDSNWFIGFNNAWIVKLPPAPAAAFKRAFIGAKIGRAKTQAKGGGKRWEREPIPGKIYMAIAPRPAFPAERSFFLAETGDLPLEPAAAAHVDGVGPARWFWKEVPMAHISTTEPNYLILWSPTREIKDAATAPILAAAESAPNERAGEARAWINNTIQGVPPRRENGALQIPINLKPALALKLVPEPGGGVTVSDFVVRSVGDDFVVSFSVEGKNVERGWVELSLDEGLAFKRVSGLRYTPPFDFRVPASLIPSRGAYLRGAALDSLAIEGHSDGVFIPGLEAQ